MERITRTSIQILKFSELEAFTDKKIKTVRGEVNIDVFAVDTSTTPASTYLCECKYWDENVSKTIVHSLRTVVQDFGANWGFIISKKGFQKGAYKATEYSPVKLLNWNEFQDLFESRWYNGYFNQFSEPWYAIIEYTEPINSRIQRKLSRLDKNKQIE